MRAHGWAVAVLLAVGLALGSCEDDGTGGSSCCRVCETGKACGDSCISTSSTCHQPAGCACNGLLPYDEEE